MRIVFAGTPDFAVPSLAALLAAGHDIAAVYTRPDRPAGRGRSLRPPPVKGLAQGHGLTVRQPASLRGEAPALASLSPEVMVVVAYGLLLPPEVLRVPASGCINVHASLLPRWRGAAPVARAIEAGDAVTGVTLMQMDEGLDTGDILLAASEPVHVDDTAGTLHERLARRGAELLTEGLDALARGELRGRPQDESQATFAPRVGKEEGWIDWHADAMLLARRVRAFEPWPGARFRHGQAVIRVHDARAEPGGEPPGGIGPGTVLEAGPSGIRVQAGAGVLRLRRLQRPGGRALDAAAFLNGYPLRPGERLDASGAGG